MGLAVQPTRFEKFFKFETQPDFQGIATGVAAAEEVDHDKEILDYFASKPFFQKWSQSQYDASFGKSKGNVRLQHDEKRPCGRLLDISFDDANKKIFVVAKVEEPIAKGLLQTGVLTGFSIGGDYVKKTPVGNGVTRYIAAPAELSVVDRPCAPTALFTSVKGERAGALRKFIIGVSVDQLLIKAEEAKVQSFADWWVRA